MEQQDSLDRIIEMLGGWPDFFDDTERGHGRSLIGQLRRDRVLDEAVFGQVVRYAVYRARFDKLSAEIKAGTIDLEDRDGDSHLSGKEQERAYCHNKLTGLERELLATPYQRARQIGTAQTSFMDALTAAPKDKGGDGTVTPFRPLGRKGRNA